ncbi:MAG: response regulator [Acidobacteria bacterium]|nr:response regulator [Acidobacteriota bacterium]
MNSSTQPGRTVLIVDDEPSVLAYLETLLGDAGYRTLTAADGSEGLAKAKSEHPDLITLDINMPKTSGLRMFRELREDPSLADIKVVVVTAVTGYADDPEEFHKFMASRPHLRQPEGFVAKPIDAGSFVKLVSGLA